MHKPMAAPPYTPIEGVTDVLHGVAVTDSYRWLEDQESPRTRDWLRAQQQYARSYFDEIPGRERIRDRVRELLDVQTYDSIQKVAQRYFFRKRSQGQEQPCIFFREGPDGPDQLLVDPAERGTGLYTAVKPLYVSPDARLLLYEVKEGGERTGTFEIIDVDCRNILPEGLPHGYLRGFAFAPDCKSYFYAHEAIGANRPHYRAAYRHVLGSSNADEQVFFAGEHERLRLHIVQGRTRLGFIVLRFLDKTYTDFYSWALDDECPPKLLIENADFTFVPLLLPDGRTLAVTNCHSPNFRIVEVRPQKEGASQLIDLIPETDGVIRRVIVTNDRIVVSYVRNLKIQVEMFDHLGNKCGQLPDEEWDTTRVLGSSGQADEFFFEQESFTKPIHTLRCPDGQTAAMLWAEPKVPFDPTQFAHTRVSFTARDGIRIPMFLVGRHGVLDGGSHPTIMTSYGGYGIPMTPQFSVFVAFLIEHGCFFALPTIRGGSEFGDQWHEAAKRRNRQVAIDDFLSAAEWLINSGRTLPQHLAIFGGSNSGLLVGAAMTQRPDLFRAVVCLAPILDMLRYHLFDDAHVWREEFGTADDPDDFIALASYSPYQQVRDNVAYPATMIISGDSDQNCNPLHARKMTARLQAANVSELPIFLDYSRQRGHSPVLPLSERIEALTDRMAFLCDQLQLPV